MSIGEYEFSDQNVPQYCLETQHGLSTDFSKNCETQYDYTVCSYKLVQIQCWEVHTANTNGLVQFLTDPSKLLIYMSS